MFSRVTLAAVCAAGLSGLVATSAEAQSAPAVGPALTITPESAIVTGAVDTGNLAPGTSYTVEYDTLSDWNAGGNSALYAGPFFIDASSAVQFVEVPIGCYPAASCGVAGTPLTPDTQYVYVIQSQPGISASYALAETLNSTVGEFKTGSLGKVLLRSKTVKVSGGSAQVELKCTSSVTCAGTALIGTGGHKLASGKYKIAAGSSTTVGLKLTGAGKAKTKAKAKAIGAKLKLTSTTDQKNLNTAVTIG